MKYKIIREFTSGQFNLPYVEIEYEDGKREILPKYKLEK